MSVEDAHPADESSPTSRSGEGREDHTSLIKAAYARRSESVDRAIYTYFNQGNLFMVQDRERRILRLLARQGYNSLEEMKLLEIGCGGGYWLRQLVQWGAQPENLVGIDLIPARVDAARRLCPAGVLLTCGSAAQLAWPDAHFDVVLQSTVFTSILDTDVQRQIAAEMLRVLKPTGFILWYDYHVNNPRNRDVRGVKKSAIKALFPNCKVELERITLAPPIVRKLAPYSWWLCDLLDRLYVFRTHYLGAIRK